MAEEQQTKEQEYLDNWKRAQADFVNYKKEEAERMGELVKFGNERVILDILDVMEGLDLVLKQFETLLKKYGVERVAVAGQAFDPAVHEAVAELDEKLPLAEVRPGYVMHGKVIRPARVKN